MVKKQTTTNGKEDDVDDIMNLAISGQQLKKRRQVNKKTLVDEIHDTIGLNKTDIKLIVDEVFFAMAQHLKNGISVQVRDFGMFYVKQSKDRLGVNPQTLERAIVPAKKRVAFRPYIIIEHGNDRN